MSSDSEQAQTYQRLVQEYETLGNQIQDLIRRTGGHTENMSPSDMQIYRQLACLRDDLYNQIKAIEAEWLED
jgi:hypothetical protein